MRRACLFLILALLGATPGRSVVADCRHLASATAPDRPASRPALVARDLIELRDIGLAGAAGGPAPLAVSPDGRFVAFQMRRADLAANDYCLGLFILNLRAPHDPVRQVDQGGEWIFAPGLRAGALTPALSGYPLVVVPSWSPDGRRIAYLRRDHGVVQAWVARTDGRGARPVTRSESDVSAVRWNADGSALLVSIHPGVSAAADVVRREALTGYHYDDRWAPVIANAPMAIDREPPQEYRVALSTGDIAPIRPQDLPEPVHVERWQAALVPVEPANLLSATVVEARGRNGDRMERCAAVACQGRISDAWWDSRHGAILFLRREGWDHEQSALYAWQPSTARPRRILSTQSLITGCEPAPGQLICMAETALRPGHIVAIDSASGRVRELYDPNPDFAAKPLGTVQRLRWKNGWGFEAFGDLVLPPGHQPGERHPLVVVQYQSRGFLRGGTGDAYPIQLLATAGYALLSVESPQDVTDLLPARTIVEVNRHNVVDAADNRSKTASIEIGVKAAIATGAVDSERIAITGLSDGAAKARWALLHGSLFKTAIISSCCDAEGALALTGPEHARDFIQYGYPPLSQPTPTFWKNLSLLANVDTFDTPLLIQATEHEYLTALSTVSGLQERGRPVDLFVFPDEYHVLWQPAHRAAAYQRDIDWLDFWLKGATSAPGDPRRVGEEQRWAMLRNRWRSPAGKSVDRTLPPFRPS